MQKNEFCPLTPYSVHFMPVDFDNQNSPQSSFASIVKDRGRLSAWIDIKSDNSCERKCKDSKMKETENQESPD